MGWVGRFCVKHWPLEDLVNSCSSLAVVSLIHRFLSVHFSLGRTWSLDFVAVAGGLLCRQSSTALSVNNRSGAFRVLEVFAGRGNSNLKLSWDCFERFVAQIIPIVPCVFWLKKKFRWSAWVWFSGSWICHAQFFGFFIALKYQVSLWHTDAPVRLGHL